MLKNALLLHEELQLGLGMNWNQGQGPVVQKPVTLTLG